MGGRLVSLLVSNSALGGAQYYTIASLSSPLSSSSSSPLVLLLIIIVDHCLCLPKAELMKPVTPLLPPHPTQSQTQKVSIFC